MTECKACGDKPKKRVFPSAVVEINNPEQLVLLRKVVLPATLTEVDNPPVVGKYRNVILQYEDTGHIYLYSSDGIPTAIESNVPQEILDRITDLESDLAYETSVRQTADTELGDRIDTVTEDLTDEATARETADAALSTRIDGVASAITAEITARQAADTNLQSQIDAITASSDVTDIVGTYAQLQAYDTSTLGDNDIIKVLQDESHNDETTYYRWNATAQQFTLIGEEGPYYTKSQTDALLNTKQDGLTAGTGIDITNNVVSATSSGPTVVQTTGTSTTDVMSQNAVTGMIYASGYDPSTGSSDGTRVAIGGNSEAGARTTIAIGAGRGLTAALAIDSVALGESAAVGSLNYRGSVALGSYATCTAAGQVQIGTSQTVDGYLGNSNYRLLSGLYDGQSDHDAVTVGQLNTAIAGVTGTEEINSTDWSALWQ